MYSRIRPYVNGFILSSYRLPPVNHYSEIVLPNGLFLQRDATSNYELSTSENGTFVYIQGHWAISSTSPVEQISTRLLSASEESLKDFESLLNEMVGRHFIILGKGTETYMYGDPLGNRTIYYSTLRPLVSSHLELLLEFEPHPKIETGFKSTRWAADYTVAEDVRILLPNFRLDFTSRSVTRFYPAHPNRFAGIDHETKLSLIEEKFDRVIASYLTSYDQLAFAFSGGMDSRFLLALLRPFWEKLTTYTYGYQKYFGEEKSGYFRATMSRDFEQAQSVLASTNVRESLFFDLMEDKPILDVDGLAEAIEANSPGNHGRALVPLYVSAFSGSSTLNIRGNGVEIVRRVEIPDISFETLARRGRKNLAFDPAARLRELGYDQPMPVFGRGPLAHWELKNGKWLSEIQNELDPAFDTLIPFANRDIIEIFHSFPALERASGVVFRDLIDRRAPELNLSPSNSEPSVYASWREQRLEEETRKYPFSGIYVRSQSTSEDVPLTEPGPRTFNVPSGYFDPNFSVVATFPVPKPGDFTFKITQPYQAQKGIGYFELTMHVNDRLLLKVDGAKVGRPITASVYNLRGGDSVEISIHPLKTVKSDRSWSAATKTTVSIFYEESFGEGKPTHFYSDLDF